MAPKNVDMYSFFGGGERGSQKVYGLYNHENVDIYGRPLSLIDKQIMINPNLEHSM